MLIKFFTISVHSNRNIVHKFHKQSQYVLKGSHAKPLFALELHDRLYMNIVKIDGHLTLLKMSQL